MSDKNPYYSIPKALGKPAKQIDLLPVDPAPMEMLKLREQFERDLYAAMSSRAVDRS